jgi:hypothetical protein
MIRAFFWLPKGTNVGHSALQIGESGDELATYISWWPKAHLNFYKKAPGVGQSLEDDERAEGRPADLSVEFKRPNNADGLDDLAELAIHQWWIAFVSKDFDYGLGGKNCSWAIIEALRAGGSDKYFPYRLNVKRNIPLKSALLSLLGAALRLVILHGDMVGSAHVIIGLKRYADAVVKNLRPGGSLKLTAVAIADEFFQRLVAAGRIGYCLVLQQNMDRARSGKLLLGADFKASSNA